MASNNSAQQQLPKKKHNSLYLFDFMMTTVLDTNKPIEDLGTIGLCKWMIAGSRIPQDFAAEVKSYDSVEKCDLCGTVCAPNSTVYRCFTCGTSPSMAVCLGCFAVGNHQGHVFNSFVNNEKPNVQKEAGEPTVTSANKTKSASDLMRAAEIVIPKLLLKLLRYFKCKPTDKDNDFVIKNIIPKADAFLAMLIDLSGMGSLMRHTLMSLLTSPQIYKCLMQNTLSSKSSNGCQVSSQNSCDHPTLLKEFVFWMIFYKYPASLTRFLFGLLPDQNYEAALSLAFNLHSKTVIRMSEKSADNTPSNQEIRAKFQDLKVATKISVDEITSMFKRALGNEAVTFLGPLPGRMVMERNDIDINPTRRIIYGIGTIPRLPPSAISLGDAIREAMTPRTNVQRVQGNIASAVQTGTKRSGGSNEVSSETTSNVQQEGAAPSVQEQWRALVTRLEDAKDLFDSAVRTLDRVHLDIRAFERRRDPAALALLRDSLVPLLARAQQAGLAACSEVTESRRNELLAQRSYQARRDLEQRRINLEREKRALLEWMRREGEQFRRIQTKAERRLSQLRREQYATELEANCAEEKLRSLYNPLTKDDFA